MVEVTCVASELRELLGSKYLAYDWRIFAKGFSLEPINNKLVNANEELTRCENYRGFCRQQTEDKGILNHF